jgi:hypothetical protein
VADQTNDKYVFMKQILIVLLFLWSCSNEPSQPSSADSTSQNLPQRTNKAVAFTEISAGYKTIPKNNDGGWYYNTPEKTAALGLHSGDTIEMVGDYAYIQMVGLKVPEGSAPIVFKPKGKVRVGTNNSYAWIMQDCNGFKIIGDYRGADRFLIGGPDSGKYIAQSLTFTGSSNVEIIGAELLNAQVGFHQNRKEAGGEWPMKNISIHGCYVHDLANPTEGGRAEGFYLGNTEKAFYKKGAWMDGVSIYDNRVERVSGDGIQIAKATNMLIKNNAIRVYGTANLEDQRTGIIVGGCSEGSVLNNIIEDGRGGAIQVFGAGLVTLDGNRIARTSTNPTDDAIYIDGKCSDGGQLQVRLLNNTVDKAARKLVYDVKGNAVIENTGNSWNPPVVPPVTPPTKKLMYTVTTKIYDSGAPETTTVTVKN